MNGTITITAEKTPRPLTKLTLHPVPLELTEEHWTEACKQLEWGKYYKHEYLTYKDFPNLQNGYMHLFLEDALVENMWHTHQIFGHQMQVIKPGESFGPKCAHCLGLGHWANRCPIRHLCKICKENHHVSDCPFGSPIERTPEPEIKKAKKQQQPDKSTPKWKTFSNVKPDDFTALLAQIEKQNTKKKLNDQINPDNPLQKEALQAIAEEQTTEHSSTNQNDKSSDPQSSGTKDLLIIPSSSPHPVDESLSPKLSSQTSNVKFLFTNAKKRIEFPVESGSSLYGTPQTQQDTPLHPPLTSHNDKTKSAPIISQQLEKKTQLDKLFQPGQPEENKVNNKD
uniref:ZF(CCHC)-6 zinc finger protein n=1 Tax=Phallusia mammillata TaxID=59560 RepID=A0A6F9DD38_9ASCI|nr:ZF(CCHC)-6 zinc finger protein [Phallusia mammillata]